MKRHPNIDHHMFSIIIPIFNADKYLNLCLNSILNQTYIHFELILVNDGSTDNSKEICEEFAKRDSRIKVVNKINGGVSTARNVGIKLAKGDWLLFADADDELYPDSLSNLFNLIENNITLIIGGYTKCNEKGKTLFQNNQKFCYTINRDEALMYMYLPKEFPYQGYLWNKLFRADIIKDNNLHFDEEIFFNEDRLFITQYLCKCNGNIKYFSTPVYKYFERNTGAMASLKKGFNKKYLSDTIAYIKMYQEIKKICPHQKLKKTAQAGILDSYITIKKMLSDYNVTDTSIQLKQNLLIIKNIPLLYIKVNVANFLNIIKERLF